MIDKRYKAFFFDLDGVLIDSSRAWHQTIDQIAKNTNHPRVSWQRFRSTFGQGTHADQAMFFPSISVEELDRFYKNEFTKHIDHIERIPFAKDLLIYLKKRELKTALITNTPRDLALKILDYHSMDKLFDHLSAGGDCADKPDPSMIFLALKSLGLKEKDIIYLGDSPTDEKAAISAKVDFISVGFQSPYALFSVNRVDEMLNLLDI